MMNNNSGIITAQGNCELQEERFAKVTQQRAASNSCLTYLNGPLVRGWYPENKLVLAPTAEQNAFWTMSEGRLWRRNTWCTNRSAFSLAEVSWGRATKCTAFEKWSIIVKITVIHLDGERQVTKSTAICDQGQGNHVIRGCALGELCTHTHVGSIHLNYEL